MGSDSPRKREKNFSPEFCSYPTRARKFQNKSKKNQKIKKSLSGIIFCQNWRILAEKEGKKIFVPNSVYTRPREENSEKNSKKIKKMKKPLSGISISQNGMR